MSRIVSLTLVLLSLCFSTSPVLAQMAKPWLHSYPTPQREYFVSPVGSITNSGTQAQPLSLNQAISQAQPGDIYWLLEGTYAGYFVLNKDATAEKPIVYRAYMGQRAQIVGSLKVDGDHTWLWGLEVSDPLVSVTSTDSGVNVQAAGVHLINNVIHDVCRRNGIGGWDVGSGQIYYGNTVYDNGCIPIQNDPGQTFPPHNIYTQNNFVVNGFKYYVNNVILEPGCTSKCFAFHAYGLQGAVTGFYLENNIVANTDTNAGSIRFLVGGNNTQPEDRHVVQRNYFYQTNVQFGYKQLNQSEFRDNYLGRSILNTNFFWGAGEEKFTKQLPNVYMGNSFINPLNGTAVSLTTGAYFKSPGATLPSLQISVPKIDNRDSFNQNTYSVPVKNTLKANNTSQSNLSLAQWQTQTAAAGKAFDAESTEVPPPTTAKVVIQPNEYDPSRTHIAIYNWGNQATLSVDTTPFVPAGKNLDIYTASNQFGEPLYTGNSGQNIQIPTQGKEFLVLIAVTTSPSPSASPSPVGCQGDINEDTVINLLDYSLLIKNFLKSGTQIMNPKADLNQDQKVDLLDYSLFVTKFLNPCP